MRPAVAALLALPLAVAAVPTWAQNAPSAAEIIQSLKPSAAGLTDATRGIRMVSPKGAAPSVSLDVEFATGSAELTPAAYATLDRLGQALASSDLAPYHFRIEGHTDTVGAADLNQALSQRRADAVASYLHTRFGVATARLQAVGMGETGLAVPTPPQTANARNRRVRIVNEDAAG
jgi:OOP family OmpA-OmpF porin